MHIPTHILSGWCVANIFPLTARERLFCMLAASIPDVDGLGIVFGEEAYWALHHKLGHSVFFGTLISALFAVFSVHRGLMLALSLICFHLHLVMDYFGSGPGWAIHYLWPLHDYVWKTALAWELASWQNRLAFGLLLVAAVVIAKVTGRTPLERIAPRLDRLLTRQAGDASREPPKNEEIA